MDDRLIRVPATAIAVAYWPDTAERVQRLAHEPWFMLLDSCRSGGAKGRYDIAAWAPYATLETRGQRTRIAERGRVSESPADPFSLVRGYLEDEQQHPELPFTGGAIGLFSYDLARRIERLPDHAARDIEVPDMAVGVYDRCLVVDHERERAWFVHRGLDGESVDAALVNLEVPRTLTPAAFGTRFLVTSTVVSETPFETYAAAFARIKRYILNGDCYQVNYAQRFSAAADGDPWDAYLRLRNLNAAPYAAFARLPGIAVLSSSPERFIRVAAGEVETKPIKGTRPRDREPARDRKLARELAASAKDRAENVMIVDLLRNDIGKTCTTGSITVPVLCAVESFARVHHLVSTVRGRMRPGMHALDVLRGAFPGGSITGAPKVRAMQIIEELETTRRGVYCGAIGYVSHDGQMDTNIAIRTLVYADVARRHDMPIRPADGAAARANTDRGNRLYCWAGGGIVVDSDLASEYQESLDKAAAMLNVFADAEIENVGR